MKMVDGVGVEPTMPELQSGVLPFYDPSKELLVGRDGFEPPTFRVSAEGSNQLSYLPMESEGGIEPPFAVLQTAANSSIDNSPMVAGGGIEPPLSGSEPDALPLCEPAF